MNEPMKRYYLLIRSGEFRPFATLSPIRLYRVAALVLALLASGQFPSAAQLTRSSGELIEYDFIYYQEILVLWDGNLRSYDAETVSATVLGRARFETRHYFQGGVCPSDNFFD
jgi:hypothetical protein